LDKDGIEVRLLKCWYLVPVIEPAGKNLVSDKKIRRRIFFKT
jgi:hypothetical protein